MPDELPYLLPLAFGFCIIVMLFIYWFGGKISAKSKQANTAGKTEPYACGEDVPAQELKMNLNRFFVFAVYFLIFDVFAVILATSFNTMGMMPMVYTLVVLMAVAMFLSLRRYL